MITPQISRLGILIPVLPVTMDSFGSVLYVVCVWLADYKRAQYQLPSATLQAPVTQIFSRWFSYVIARITQLCHTLGGLEAKSLIKDVQIKGKCVSDMVFLN